MLNEEEILRDEAETKVEAAKQAESEPLVSASAPGAETAAETIRKGGLAYAALSMLIGSIVGCIIIGLLLDRYLQTSWMTVVGAIVGAIVGFYQFIRISSRAK